MEEVKEKNNDEKQNESKKNDKKYLLAFLASQVLFVIVLFFGGPKLSILSIILGIVSVVLFGIVIMDKIESSRLLKFVMLLFIVIQCGIYFVISNLFSGVLIVHDNHSYRTVWTKSSYYVTEKSDTIPLKHNSFYVDNQTNRTLEIYTVYYNKQSNPFGGGSSVNDVINPYTMTEVSTKPRYIFTSPPSTVISKKDSESRTAIRFR